MRSFHSLTVVRIDPETQDSMRVALQVPDGLESEYDFLPGQHLPIEVTIDGKRVRRTYSICSAPGEMPLEIGVRLQPGGLFSGYVAERLAVGDELQVMPPSGRFYASPDASHEGTYLAFAAGSGITPILSIIRATLETEPGSRFVLFYGNRRQQTTMFIDELYALKNRYMDRLQLYFLFSREEQEFPIFGGRLDADRVRKLYPLFCAGLEPTATYVCGPDTMIADVTGTLLELGLGEETIHAERFGVPRTGVAASRPAQQPAESGATAEVTVIMDGHRRAFTMPLEGTNIVDAAAEQGIELPYSCKGGVCATCRTHVSEGSVRMDTNYGLEPWELEKGYVLACQSHPLTPSVVLNYDKT